MECIKDPFNYMGNKFRLLNNIIPEFGNDYNLFIDVFGGGGCVGINQKCNNVIYNDKLDRLNCFMEFMRISDIDYVYSNIIETLNKFDLTKENKEAFYKLREEYNNLEDKNSNYANILLYCLISHSFNYQLGFNQKGEFNVASGTNRSSFNPALQDRFKLFFTKMKTKNLKCCNLDFSGLIDKTLAFTENKNNKLLYYLDPPYLASDDSYSRTRSVSWTKDLEILLYEYCDKINSLGQKFVLSNVFDNNGQENNILKDWSSKYIVKILDCDYSNCNYQKNRNSKNTEILIKNF